MSETQPIDPRYATPPRRPKKRRNWVLRTVGLIVLLFVLMLIAVPLYAWSRIDKIEAMPTGQRPADTPGTTYLMVGSDAREDLSRAERARLHTGGDAGPPRTDSIMLMHVPESGPTVLISIPRDSAVNIPGVKNRQKINAAFNKGPALLIQTIENATGLRIDHYIEIGFLGVVSVVDAVGGVEMCIPEAIKDPKAALDIEEGCQTLDEATALGYVRTRATASSDFGRVERQRAFISALLNKATSPSTLFNPFRVVPLATGLSGSIAVDNGTHVWHLAQLGLAMRGLSDGGISTTVPVRDGAVHWDKKRATALFEALKADERPPDNALGP